MSASNHHIFKLTRKQHDTALPRVCVAGVGTAGVRVMDRVAGDGNLQDGVQYAVLHTNRSVLEASCVQTRIPLGDEAVVHGCGGDLKKGRKAAARDVELVRGLISDCQVLILVAGLGGGTGGGALPIILQAAKGAGVFTAVVLTLPFAFEGSSRTRQAEDGLRAIQPIADFTAIASNDSLVQWQKQEGMERALADALTGLSAGVCSLWQMLAVPALLALDQGDLRALSMQGASLSYFMYGMATGEERAVGAHQNLYDRYPDVSRQLSSGSGVLACVCGGRDLGLQEVTDVLAPLHTAVADNGVLRAGVVLHDSWRNRILLSVFIGDTRKKVTAAVAGKAAAKPAKTKKGHSHDGSRASQEELNLDGVAVLGQGRFGRTKATILDGEDLDIPTYIRRNIKLNQ